MKRWITATWFIIAASLNFKYNWVLKVHFFEVVIKDLEWQNSFWFNCNFKLSVFMGLPRPEIIIDSKDTYIFAIELDEAVKQIKMSEVIRAWIPSVAKGM